MVLWAILASTARPAAAELVRMRYPEGPAHGFVTVSNDAGSVLAHGELIQWLERRIVSSQLVIRFEDGSLYDEVVRFTQRPTFRIVSYRLVHRGPSFAETADVFFDQSGRYQVRRRAKPDAEEETAAGHFEVPDDVSNGMVSILLKNLEPGASATTHIVAFRPEPLILELHLRPEGTDGFSLGRTSIAATRFVIRPEVRGLKGVVATLSGKQPSPLRMWIVQGQAPTLVRFEGALYTDGPSWRIGLAAPRLER